MLNVFSNNTFRFTKTTFNLNNTGTISTGFYKSDFHRYSPPCLATINNSTSYSEIYIPREEIYLSLQKICISIHYNVAHNVANVAANT